MSFLSKLKDRLGSTTYPSGDSFVRALARSILGGAVLDFTHSEGGNYPTTDMGEEVLTKVISGKGLVEDDFIVGSAARRFFKRRDWGSGGKNFIRGTGGYFGIPPPSSRIGDEVYTIVGCRQPLLLRRDLVDNAKNSVVGECYVEGCARGEPLLGNLADHIGFKLDYQGQSSRSSRGFTRCFRDLDSGWLFNEDPRLKSLGLDLSKFRERLKNDPEPMLSIAPEVLLARIRGLKYVDLI